METGNGKITDSVYGLGSICRRKGWYFQRKQNQQEMACSSGWDCFGSSFLVYGNEVFARPENVDARNGQGQESGMLFQENSKAGEGHMPDSDY